MSLSFRIYFKPGENKEKINQLQELLGISSKVITQGREKYLQCFISKHIYTFREEFMPDDFILKANAMASRITVCDGAFINPGGDNSDIFLKIGNTELSREGVEILMRGKNINSMLKIYKYFVDNKANVPSCKKAYTEESKLKQELKKISEINFNLVQDNKRVKSLETENGVLRLKRKLYEDKLNEFKALVKNSFWSFLFPKPKELTLKEASFEWPKDIEFPNNIATK